MIESHKARRRLTLLMVLPALLLFFVAQRFFIEGIALTGTKA